MPVLCLTAAMAEPLSAGHTVSFLRKHCLVPVSKVLFGKLGFWCPGGVDEYLENV